MQRSKYLTKQCHLARSANDSISKPVGAAAEPIVVGEVLGRTHSSNRYLLENREASCLKLWNFPKVKFNMNCSLYSISRMKVKFWDKLWYASSSINLISMHWDLFLTTVPCHKWSDYQPSSQWQHRPHLFSQTTQPMAIYDHKSATVWSKTRKKINYWGQRNSEEHSLTTARSSLYVKLYTWRPMSSAIALVPSKCNSKQDFNCTNNDQFQD